MRRSLCSCPRLPLSAYFPECVAPAERESDERTSACLTVCPYRVPLVPLRPACRWAGWRWSPSWRRAQCGSGPASRRTKSSEASASPLSLPRAPGTHLRRLPSRKWRRCWSERGGQWGKGGNWVMAFWEEERGEDECLIRTRDGAWSCWAQRLSRGWRSSPGDVRPPIPGTEQTKEINNKFTNSVGQRTSWRLIRCGPACYFLSIEGINFVFFKEKTLYTSNIRHRNYQEDIRTIRIA